jgi:hypothetical protein
MRASCCGEAMSERARVVSWWVYVAAVLVIFEVTFLRSNFAYAVGAALLSIVLLGSLLKLFIRWRTRPRPRKAARPGGGT